MTKALFVTVAAHELASPVNAWRNSMGPAGHITYPAIGPKNDEAILACAQGYKPDVIFYIGANGGKGLPRIETLQALRRVAPCVHYQSDVEDETWHFLLRTYIENDCFDLIISQTGVDNPLIDFATLIAIDLTPYTTVAPNKRIHCGFSGSYQSLANYERDQKAGVINRDGRGEVLHTLGGILSLRKRQVVGSYVDYVEYIRDCRIMLNVSLTGMGDKHHVKWRVLEAAFAGCALLEMKDSPTSKWFPEDTYLQYDTIEEARSIIKGISYPEIDAIADKFKAHANQHYRPEKIYGNIIEKLGVSP